MWHSSPDWKHNLGPFESYGKGTLPQTPFREEQARLDGDVFRWSWMWGRIAGWFGIEPVAFDGTVRPLAEQMAGDAELWRRIAERERLVEPDLARLASPWHTDADLGRPIEVVTDMSKSRRFGFTAYQPTDGAFMALFAQLRTNRLIP